MSVTILQTHSVQIGEVVVNFTIGRIGKIASQAKATEDNGATVQADGRQADSVAGVATRPSVGGGTDASHSVSDDRPESSERLQVLRELTNAAEPDVLASTRERASMERGISQCVTGGESAAPESQSDGGVIAEVKGRARPADAVGVEPPPSETNLQPTSSPEADKPEAVANVSGNQFQSHAVALRPHCLRPGSDCGGYGRNHCAACLKAMAESEAA